MNTAPQTVREKDFKLDILFNKGTILDDLFGSAAVSTRKGLTAVQIDGVKSISAMYLDRMSGILLVDIDITEDNFVGLAALSELLKDEVRQVEVHRYTETHRYLLTSRYGGVTLDNVGIVYTDADDDGPLVAQLRFNYDNEKLRIQTPNDTESLT